MIADNMAGTCKNKCLLVAQLVTLYGLCKNPWKNTIIDGCYVMFKKNEQQCFISV